MSLRICILDKFLACGPHRTETDFFGEIPQQPVIFKCFSFTFNVEKAPKSWIGKERGAQSQNWGMPGQGTGSSI